MTGRMMRTKCSGTGKKVRELLLFVPRALGLFRRDWLRIGYKLWREAASFARDYFLPRISSDYATFIPKLASRNDLAGMLNEVLTLLMVPVVDDVGTGLVELAEERETPTSAEARKESQQEEVGRQQSEVTEESGFDCSHVTDKLRCLYLFSGKRRVGDLRECLAVSLKSSKATLVMREIDAVKGMKNQNLLSAKLQNALMAEVVVGKFDLVVASPPCSTFSRARSGSRSWHVLKWFRRIGWWTSRSSCSKRKWQTVPSTWYSWRTPKIWVDARTVLRQLRSGNGRQCRHWRQRWASSPGPCTNATSVQCI